MHAEFVVTQNWPPQGLRLLAQATGAALLLQEALAIYTSGKNSGEAFCVIFLQ